MESFLKIFISLTLCLAMAECTVLERIRRDMGENEKRCREEIQNCESRLMSFGSPEGFAGVKDFLTDAAQMERFCIDLRGVRDCIAGLQSSPSCEGGHAVHHLIKYESMSGYLCREQTQRKIQAATRSRCFESEESLVAAMRSGETCARQSGLEQALQSGDGSAICSAISNLRRCLLGDVHERCGPEMYALMEDLADYMAGPELLDRFFAMTGERIPRSCLDEPVTNNAAKRSVNAFSLFKFLS